MSFSNIFGKKTTSACTAKERLKIIVAHEHSRGAWSGRSEFLQNLHKEILEVVRRYVMVEQDAVYVNLGQQDNCEVLELNITLPEQNGKSEKN